MYLASPRHGNAGIFSYNEGLHFFLSICQGSSEVILRKHKQSTQKYRLYRRFSA